MGRCFFALDPTQQKTNRCVGGQLKTTLYDRVPFLEPPINNQNMKKNQIKQIEELPQGLTSVAPRRYQLNAAINLRFFLRGNYTLKTLNSCISCDGYQMKPNCEFEVVEAEFYNQLIITSEIGQIEIETDKLDFKYDDTDVQYTYLSETKEQLLRDIVGERVLILGAKNTGKSTTCLQMCNMLLSENASVYLLDLDVGQPFNWGTPGFITLYELTQPTFCSKQKIIYNGFVGEFSTQHYMEHYLQHVQLALSRCTGRLIINTHGYIQSFGKVLAQYLVRILRPNNILILSNSQASTEKARQLQDCLFGKINFSLSTQIPLEDTNVPNITLIEEDYMHPFSNINLSQQINPQGKKLRREKLLLQQLGLVNIKQNLSIYTQLCLMPTITMKICDQKFLILPFSLDQPINFDQLTDPLQIAKVFNCSLVSLQSTSLLAHSSGIGMIKDFDLDKGTLDVITTICGVEWVMVKSQHFELGRETLQIKIEEILELSDMSCLLQGKAIGHKYQIPYIYPISKAVGFKSPKLNINKKIQKKKL